MTKQELARKRNFFKFYLMGMYRKIDAGALTQEEHKLYEELLNIRQVLLKKFDENSEVLGLNVPEKCWCGKPARYDYEGTDPRIKGRVCHKHRKDESV